MSGGGGGLGDFNLATPFAHISGANKQASLAQQMAMEEQRARQAVTAEARAGADRMRLAAQSPQQLAALERSYNAAQTQLDTEMRQLAAIDPAIMEASKQVLGILQGKQASVNDPAMAQRNAQRQQLINSLRAQYGPGAESSSIGQRALQQFDMQSASMFQQNQQGALGNLFGIATTRVNGAGFGNMLNTAAGYGQYQDRQLQAEGMGTQGILQGLQGEVNSAGAQYTEDMMKANFQRQKYEQVSSDMRQIGRSWSTMGMGNKGGGGGGGGGGGVPQSQNMAGNSYTNMGSYA